MIANSVLLLLLLLVSECLTMHYIDMYQHVSRTNKFLLPYLPSNIKPGSLSCQHVVHCWKKKSHLLLLHLYGHATSIKTQC